MTRLGFEPKTHSLEGCCSIQLSYQAIALTALKSPIRRKPISRFAGAKVRLFLDVWTYFREKIAKALCVMRFLPAWEAHKDGADVSDGQVSLAWEQLWPGDATS